MDFQLIIIGGGLAGLSAARAYLETGGRSLALVEKQRVGSHNHSPLTFADVAADFDLEPHVRASYTGFTFHNPAGSVITFRFGTEQLCVLDYRKSCQAILETIGRLGPDTEIIRQAAEGVDPGTNGVAVRLKNGETLTGRTVVDASGASQIASRNAGGGSSRYSHVYGALLEKTTNPDPATCAYLLPSPEYGSGGGWFYPIGATKASFGYAVISNSPKPDMRDLKRIFEDARHQIQPYSDSLRGSTIEVVELGVIPLVPIRPLTRPGVIMVGDAAGMATNWTCMGTEPVLRYGAAAGKLAARVVETGEMSVIDGMEAIWQEDNAEAYDMMERMADTFWSGGHRFWEWIIRNDLANLTPGQCLDRMRYNRHILKRHQVLGRSLKDRLRRLFSKRPNRSREFIIQD